MDSKTPFADGLRDDMQAFGEVLARHTRGLSEYLHAQATRIQLREADVMNNLLDVSEGVKNSPPLDTLDKFKVKELKALCKKRGIKGYTRKRKPELVQLLKDDQSTAEESNHPARLEALMVLIAKALKIPQDLMKTGQATVEESNRLVRLEALIVLVAKALEIPQDLIGQVLKGRSTGGHFGQSTDCLPGD